MKMQEIEKKTVTPETYIRPDILIFSGVIHKEDTSDNLSKMHFTKYLLHAFTCCQSWYTH